MTLQIVTGTAPSHWAPYFINGDASSMEPEDIRQADEFAKWLGGNIVSCEDVGFMHRHDATRFGVLASDCQEYTALVEMHEPEWPSVAWMRARNNDA